MSCDAGPGIAEAVLKTGPEASMHPGDGAMRLHKGSPRS